MQVHPEKLTTALMAAAEALGARVVRGTVSGIQLDASGSQVEGTLSPARGLALPFPRFHGG
jgi:hypothetical protein